MQPGPSGLARQLSSAGMGLTEASLFSDERHLSDSEHTEEGMSSPPHDEAEFEHNTSETVPRRGGKREREPSPSCTLIVSHKQCTTHTTGKTCPEQPARVRTIMAALKKLHKAMKADSPFSLRELKSSESMLMMLEAQLVHLTDSTPSALVDASRTATIMSAAAASDGDSTPLVDESPSSSAAVGPLRGGPTALQRTDSVNYMEFNVLPAVRAVHTHSIA